MNHFDSQKNYYEVLGASRNASRREIESLYKRLAHQRHPDRGGSEEDMKTLNEAYRVLHNDEARKEYDAQRLAPSATGSTVKFTPAAREVGASGQAISAMLCLLLGFMLLLLVRFNGLWFLWPLGILAFGVMLFGVLMAHSALSYARNSLRVSHPARRFRAVQEVMFWGVVCGAVYGLYLVLTEI